jgi:hypothetical protein
LEDGRKCFSIEEARRYDWDKDVKRPSCVASLRLAVTFDWNERSFSIRTLGLFRWNTQVVGDFRFKTTFGSFKVDASTEWVLRDGESFYFP